MRFAIVLSCAQSNAQFVGSIIFSNFKYIGCLRRFYFKLVTLFFYLFFLILIVWNIILTSTDSE